LLVIHQVRYARDIFPEDAGRAEAESNARLMAAAPELYEACRQAADLFKDDEGISRVLREALRKAQRPRSAEIPSVEEIQPADDGSGFPAQTHLR
jgi:hypothetical protein